LIIPDLKREKRDNLVVPFFFIKNLKKLCGRQVIWLAESLSAAV